MHAALVVFLLVLLPTVAEAQWYRTYEEGVQAADKGDWSTVEAKMQAATNEAAKDGVRPGRNVRTYGMRFVNFAPDYYLGLAYLNTKRPQDARAALQRVEQQKLFTSRDKEYAVLTKSLSEATVALNAGNNPGGGGATPPTTKADPPVLAPTQTSSTGTTTAGGTNPAAGGGAGVGAQIDAATTARAEFDRLLKSAQASYAGRNYQEALASARAARATGANSAAADSLIADVTRAMSRELLTNAETAMRANRLTDAANLATSARELGVEAARAEALLFEVDVMRLLQAAESQRSDGQLGAARASANEIKNRLAAKSPEAAVLAPLYVPQAEKLLVLVDAESAYVDAVARADAAAARAALDRLRSIDGKNARLAAYARTLAELVNGDVQRLALRQFFAGNYQQVVTMLTPASAGADASPRVLFYLACSQAALALLQGRQDGEEVRAARELFARVRGQLGGLAPDRRLVSPKVLELLEGPSRATTS